MRKSEYIGWKEVFRFTLNQGMKEKAFKGFLIVMSVILIISQPVMSFINNRDKKEEVYHCAVAEFTIYDEVGLPIDYTKALSGEAFEGVKINVLPTMSFEDHVKLLEEKSKEKGSEKSKELILHMVYEETGYFNLTFVKASNSALQDDDCQKLATAFETYFEKERINAIEVTKEQLEFLNRPVDTKLEFLTETGEVLFDEEHTESINMEEYWMIYVLLMVAMLIISFSGGSIATSVVTEKSTKVVEYLMINVRPMALLTGKILACLLLVLIQFAVMGISYMVSGWLNLALFGEKSGMSFNIAGQDTLDQVSTIMEMLSGISIGVVVVGVVVILGGIMFFCILAGLCGASVSKLDEMSEGLKLYTMLLMVGVYLALGLCVVMMGGGANQLFVNICCLFPLSAPFITPACLIIGKIPMSIALISLILLLVIIVLLFAFTANVYESLIFYNGNVLKLKDILQIAKKRRQVERKGEKNHE